MQELDKGSWLSKTFDCGVNYPKKKNTQVSDGEVEQLLRSVIQLPGIALSKIKKGEWRAV